MFLSACVHLFLNNYELNLLSTATMEGKPMRKLLITTLITSSLMTGVTFAQEASSEVTFTMMADMGSLRDAKMTDDFKIVLSDAKISTTFESLCQGGKSSFFKGRTAETCAITGIGVIVQAKKPRTQYSGYTEIGITGETVGETIAVEYLVVGKAPAASASFGGEMVLKAENPSASIREKMSKAAKYISDDAGAGVVIDKRIDPVEFNNFVIPSAGFPSDPGCKINGNMLFVYQTSSWSQDLVLTCGDKDYVLKGNMPWTESADTANQTQYDLTLTLPTDGIAGDDALFATDSGDDDLFASADGISGQIIMKESSYVKVMVDGVEEELASKIEATGTFVGTNVPLDVVRAYATIYPILARTMFGS